MSDLIELKIDKTFKNLIPHLSADEYLQLEANLITDGCRDPICIWNGTIIDGHNRYEICYKHNIPFEVQQVKLNSKVEAIAWICANQIGRRNISEETRKYLIGKRYEAEKSIGNHNVVGKNQYSSDKEVRTTLLCEPPTEISQNRTAQRLGDEYNLSHTTVSRYGAFSKAIDILAKKDAELVPKILSGQAKISHENVVELSKLSNSDVKRLSHQINQKGSNFINYSGEKKRTNNLGISGSKPEVTIKNMPVFDPDAEISSLTLTIPSWISIIERTRSSANLDLVSAKAKNRLIDMLHELRDISEQMLNIMKE